jgi:hypothetical protein
MTVSRAIEGSALATERASRAAPPTLQPWEQLTRESFGVAVSLTMTARRPFVLVTAVWW